MLFRSYSPVSVGEKIAVMWSSVRTSQVLAFLIRLNSLGLVSRKKQLSWSFVRVNLRQITLVTMRPDNLNSSETNRDLPEEVID